jgi:hypothetical protein
MHDPYAPTHYASDPVRPDAEATAPHGMQWRRIVLASAAIFLAIAVSAAVSAFSLSMLALRFADGRWQDVADISYIVQSTIFVLVASAGYGWFAAGVRYRRLLHVLIAWSLVQLAALAVLLVVRPGGLGPPAWQPWLLELLPAFTGWALTGLWPGRSRRAPRVTG